MKEITTEKVIAKLLFILTVILTSSSFVRDSMREYKVTLDGRPAIFKAKVPAKNQEELKSFFETHIKNN